MIDRLALLADLKKQVLGLEDHLRERSAETDIHDRLHGEWQRAREAKRIAATYETWLDDRVTQAAVAWVLGTVFLRFCEDNRLIELPFLAGPGEKLALAQDRQADYIREHPHDTDRDWILAGFTEMSRSPVAKGLFDKAHNPMWQIEIPHHAAKELLAFWRRRREDGEIVHDFTDSEWSTRFLGDLYQDLSEHAKKIYALLQTPEFIEEFILDYTLEPAVDEFGLAELRLIDPTCGSGHFLLGAFHRLVAKWRAAEPATDSWELIRRSLTSVHGADKNPFAVGIARFRILVAAMKEAGVELLAMVPEFSILVATGDSLLHGRGGPGIQQAIPDDFFSESKPHIYATEDIHDYASSGIDLLGVGSYHVVVGNPPYITVKDKRENENYRLAYKSCSGKYALSVPFAERFFQLARRGGQDDRGAGYVGQITANSFMKREFGKKLVEEYFKTIDLLRVIDTSGAYIPGHGTPTVILIGRRRWPKQDVDVRAILGVRGEPSQPKNPADGLVWQAIVNQDDGEWISVAELSRETLSTHPWSLGGGGASELLSEIDAKNEKMRSRIKRIGFYGVMGADDAMIAQPIAFVRDGIEAEFRQQLAVGDEVRDWGIDPGDEAFHPYDVEKNLVPLSELGGHARRLWSYRTELGNRATFSKGTYFSDGRSWYEWHQIPKDIGAHKWSLVFAFVATHNHFVLDRGQRVFKQTAPLIKLPETATEDEYLALLGLLNSSIACFWIKQVCQNRGSTVDSKGARQTTIPWEDFYEIPGGLLEKYPIPEILPLALGRELDELAQRLRGVEPPAIWGDGVPTRDRLNIAQVEYGQIRGRMIVLQEELDWEVYRLYGLLSEEEAARMCADQREIPQLKLGERAFEILLARKAAEDEAEMHWLVRHGSTPVTEIPGHWPEAYRKVVEKRIEYVESRRDIELIERPECKRRWASEPWEKKERAALRNWLLDRCEDRALWFELDEYGNEQPQPLTVSQLSDQLRKDADFVSVARLYAGEDAELAKVIADITQDEHLPHLAALRYKDPGLRKRAQWERTWELQREEDATGKRLDIPVPPKYTSADFLKASYWRNRGKLDVPKERFISYPGSNPDGDSSLLLGWAGWDHRQQAQAFMTLIDERTTKDGWETDRLTPLLAGLAEVLPWVKQWHGEIDPTFGQSPADAFTTYLEGRQRDLGLSAEALKDWRPPKATRGRAKKA
jgi:hypothetical protein